MRPKCDVCNILPHHIGRAALEVFEGRYEAAEIAAMVDRITIINQAMQLILDIES